VRAIVLEGPRRAALCEVAVPRCSDGEVLVAVERAGICGSDLAVFKGARPSEYPLIMGHEAIGRIVDGGLTEHPPGSRVVIEPNIPCGSCSVCRRGHGNVCSSKRSLGMNWPGTFAEFVAVPSGFAHPLPPEVAPNDAVGIEPLAVALHAVQAGAVSEGERVAVIGCGAEGLLLIQVLVACGARVVAADIAEHRLAVARRLGAESLVLVQNAEDASEPLLCAPVVFESAGTAPALEMALRAAAPGGRVVALGLASSPAQLVPLAFVRRGLTLFGSLIYDHPADFQHAIDLVHQRRIQPSLLVEHVVNGLAAVPSAFEALLADHRSGKTLIDIVGAAE
jgi:2-desacetyl-2-hydroxyethyl bacteriochlorophyllide A dehydrogenase